MPQFTRSGHELHTEIQTFSQSLLHDAKLKMLTKQIANKKQYLTGLKIAMLLPVVAESYKLICASQYLSTYGVPYTEWNILAHIMVDYKMLREACSQEVNKRALAEHEKRKKLAAAQKTRKYGICFTQQQLLL
ncbi:hypothetical protein DSO57_1031710 [Entomophthora muscae]|uniref:Uncharacterized protein n=1 Tax=Entomophthora muscae TaxID=34485 RepID=A0ACC2S2N2_9FUNG|nr:hypothetical protein DSO57_1031710 [Entomophthora muscae]